MSRIGCGGRIIDNPDLTPDPTGGYVAYDLEIGTASQGDDIAEALANLHEAVELYLEEFPTPPNLALGGRPL